MSLVPCFLVALKNGQPSLVDAFYLEDCKPAVNSTDPHCTLFIRCYHNLGKPMLNVRGTEALGYPQPKRCGVLAALS